MEFQKVKDALVTRIRKGMPKLSRFSINELLESLNQNTIRHDIDAEDIIVFQQLQMKTFMGNRSIFHQPATNREIQGLETKLGIELPDDYKDLLRISNGLEGVWNGFYHKSYFGPSYGVEWVSRRSGNVQVPFHLVPYHSLPFEIKSLTFESNDAINIGVPESDDGGDMACEARADQEGHCNSVRNFRDVEPR